MQILSLPLETSTTIDLKNKWQQEFLIIQHREQWKKSFLYPKYHCAYHLLDSGIIAPPRIAAILLSTARSGCNKYESFMNDGYFMQR
jgi:hypothetical protein